MAAAAQNGSRYLNVSLKCTVQNADLDMRPCMHYRAPHQTMSSCPFAGFPGLALPQKHWLASPGATLAGHSPASGKPAEPVQGWNASRKQVLLRECSSPTLGRPDLQPNRKVASNRWRVTLHGAELLRHTIILPLELLWRNTRPLRAWSLPAPNTQHEAAKVHSGKQTWHRKGRSPLTTVFLEL